MRNSVRPVDGWFRHVRLRTALQVLLALGVAAGVDETRAASATWSATNIQYLYGDSMSASSSIRMWGSMA